MDAPEIRLCRDCRWIEQPTPYPRCGHPSSTVPATPDLVRGGMLPAIQIGCEAVRFSILPTRCGEQGKHWERAV
jgi:hypothetical protein